MKTPKKLKACTPAHPPHTYKPYLLPGGKPTMSFAAYLSAWRKLYKPVAKALNCKVVGIDPGLHLMELDSQRGFTISSSVANRILDLIKAADAKKTA